MVPDLVVWTVGVYGIGKFFLTVAVNAFARPTISMGNEYPNKAACSMPPSLTWSVQKEQIPPGVLLFLHAGNVSGPTINLEARTKTLEPRLLCLVVTVYER